MTAVLDGLPSICASALWISQIRAVLQLLEEAEGLPCLGQFFLLTLDFFFQNGGGGAAAQIKADFGDGKIQQAQLFYDQEALDRPAVVIFISIFFLGRVDQPVFFIVPDSLAGQPGPFLSFLDFHAVILRFHTFLCFFYSMFPRGTVNRKHKNLYGRQPFLRILAGRGEIR